MAYQQTAEPLSRWSRIVLAYRKHSGSWAWIIHRVSGIALTGYLFMHIYTLTLLSKGPVEYDRAIGAYAEFPFNVLEWLLFFPLVFHSFNGFRIVLVDLGKGAFNQKTLLRLVWAVALLGMVVTGLMILPHMFKSAH